MISEIIKYLDSFEIKNNHNILGGVMNRLMKRVVASTVLVGGLIMGF